MIKKILTVGIFALMLLTAGCQNSEEQMKYIDAGMAAIEKGAYEEALGQFDYAIAEGNNLMLAYRGEAIANMGRGEYPTAISGFSRALNERAAQKKEVRVDLLYYKAAAEYKNQQYGSAVATYKELLELTEAAEAYYLRGNAYLANKQYDEAKVDYDKAISMEQANSKRYVDIYEQYERLGVAEEGSDFLRMALERLNEKGNSSYQAGRIYFFLGDYEKAAAQLTQAMADGDIEAVLLLGEVCLALEDYGQALAMYNKYLDEAGASQAGYNGLALCRIAMEDYDGALTAIQKGLALEGDEERQSLLFNEVVVYEYQQDYPAAREKAMRYTEAYPHDEAGQKEYAFLQTR